MTRNSTSKSGKVAQSLNLGSARLYPGYLDAESQAARVADIRGVAAVAPFVQHETRRGKMSVRMTSAGQVGWVSDRMGYRYAPRHPSGVDWPPIPERVLAIWRVVSGVSRSPDTCLVNYYDDQARMGMHQDADEASFDWPVVSVSLGDEALFRIGGDARGGATGLRVVSMPQSGHNRARSASASPRRSAVNPVRPGREQR